MFWEEAPNRCTPGLDLSFNDESVVTIVIKKIIPAVAGAVLASLVLVSCASPSTTTGSDGQELTQIRFSPTAPLPSYWPAYWLADGLGFYEDEGLDVEIIDAGTAVQALLLSDGLEFAGTGQDFIPQGAELEGLQYYLATDRYPWVVITFADGDVQELTDLDGGKIGINAPHDSLDAELIMSAAGVAKENYELIPVGEDRAALIAMENGDIDAFVGAYQSMDFLPTISDRELVTVANDELENWHNIGIMTTVDKLENDRETSIAFARAVARATVWQYENPELAAEILSEITPDWAGSTEEGLRLLYMANDFNRALYENQMRYDMANLQGIIDTFAELGFIEESYPAESIATNDYIDEIWSFDIEAEKEAARNGER